MEHESNERAVAAYLKEKLECEVEAQESDEGDDTLFEPAAKGYGELHLEKKLAARTEEPKLLERLRRDDVALLVSRGERVRVTSVATEILPGR